MFGVAPFEGYPSAIRREGRRVGDQRLARQAMQMGAVGVYKVDRTLDAELARTSGVLAGKTIFLPSGEMSKSAML